MWLNGHRFSSGRLGIFDADADARRNVLDDHLSPLTRVPMDVRLRGVRCEPAETNPSVDDISGRMWSLSVKLAPA